MNYILKICPPIDSAELNALFASVWPNHREVDMQPIIDQALIYVCAYEEGRLVGFSKVIGDGGIHGFLLDPMVAPEKQRKGIGRRLVALCTEEAKRRGVEWLHVDFEPRLRNFYSKCGFASTTAGLRNLKRDPC